MKQHEKQSMVKQNRQLDRIGASEADAEAKRNRRRVGVIQLVS